MKKILSAGFATGLVALAASAQMATPFGGGMPLFFEANHGQAGNSAQFLARGRDSQFLILPAEARIVLRKGAAEPVAVRMQFVGANERAQIRGDAELPGKINYLTGNDPAQWHTGVPTFAKVRVEEIYPGIGLVYYGNQRQLEYDFEIAPGADPGAIKIHFSGADKIAVNTQGELILTLSDGEIRQPKPLLYQTVNGVRREISGGFRLVNAHTVAFAVGNYDHRLPLVIDPLLNYSTYFGGNTGEIAWAVKLDTNGFVYIAGQTFSSQKASSIPLSTPGAFQTNYNGGTLAGDAFVAKFDNLGQNLIYFTYLGGSDDDAAYALAVDSAGDAYVTGFTVSTNFPVTNAIPGGTTIGGPIDKFAKSYLADAFVAELDTGGSNLIYSTYLGGAGADAAYGIALDSSNNAYVTGFTYSTNFPTTTNAFQKHLAVTNSAFSSYYNANAFVAEISAGGTNLLYSSFFGGTNFDEGRGIAVDNANNIYVTGFTASTNFPTTNALFQQFVQTNFFGTTNQVVVTNSFNGSLLNGSTTNTSGIFDAFVAKFAMSFTNLVYSTFLGGTNNDQAYAITADTNGAAYVTGWTVSTNFPNTVTITNLQNGLTNNLAFGFSVITNVFLTKITNGAQAGIAYSAVFGGTNFGIDIGYGVALDPAGNVFVVGSTSSTNFPTFNVPGLTRATNSGQNDAFVTVFNTNATALLYSAYLGGSVNDVGYGIAADTNNAYIVGQTLSADFPVFYSDGSSPFQGSLNGTNDAFLAAIMFQVPPPEIFTNAEPISQTNAVGATIFFSINGDSVLPFFIQWLFNGTNLVNGGNISGATNATLIISNAQLTNSGTYSVIVTNYGGSAISSNAVLLITNVPPAIIVQPADQMVGMGTTATFSVVASGTVPFSYQWQTNGVNLTNGGNISGATNSTLTITNVQLGDAGNYSVIVTNAGGSITSSNAVLTVVVLPQITNQPASQSNSVGSFVVFSVGAVGQIPLSYQWWFNGTNRLINGSQTGGSIVSGATTNQLVISNAQTNNSGFYSVVVTNVIGSVTSSPAFLDITNIPPAITVQPTNQTVGVGTNVTMVVVATGTLPLAYQWQTNGVNLVNGGNISGATNAVLTINNVNTTNAGNYSVVVTNYGGSVTSSVAALTVLTMPQIFTQPTNFLAIAVSSNATFSVAAIGQNPLIYRWQATNGVNLANGTHILGANTSSLTFTNAQTTNTGFYQVVITNVVGAVTSSVVNLVVTNIPPAITLQPTNQAVTVTSNATIVVTATGTAPLSYQWQFYTNNLVTNNVVNGGNISGASTNVLKFTPAQLTNTAYYFVIVTNAGGAVTSSVAQLTVTASPLITSQPANQAIAIGAHATFTVSAVGMAPLKYQWRFNGTNLANGVQNGVQFSGVTTNVLQLNPAQLTNGGPYSVVITNVAGSVTSSVAFLYFLPAITVQPTNQTVGSGSPVTFVVGATGTTPLSYQWQLGTNLLDGATNSLFTITNAQMSDRGSYSVIVTNIAGSVISSGAVLTVTQPGFANIISAGGGSFILSGAGGTRGGIYYVLTATNLTLPFTNWTPIATDRFDNLGGFTFTNAAPANAPQLFYLLQQP